MQIRVLEVPYVENKGKYNTINVKYDQDGQTKEKMIVSFGDSESVYKTLVRAKPDQAYEIKVKKNGQYWNWIEAQLAEGSAGSTNTGTTRAAAGRAGAAWETPEERAQRQVWIIRQSSASTAFGYAAECDLSPDQALVVAKQVEDYVMGRNQPDVEID